MIKSLDSVEIQATIDRMKAEANALVALAEEDNRELTTEETEEIDRLLNEIGDDDSGLKAQLKRAQRFEALVTKQAGGTAGGTVQPQASLATPTPTYHGSITYKPKHVRNFKGQADGRDAPERAFRFGHWCLGLIHQQTRFQFPDSHEWAQAEVGGLNNVLTTSGDQHVLVPDEFLPDIIRLIEARGVARRLLRVVPMGGDTLNVPRETGQMTAYHINQSSAGTESDVTNDDISLVAKTVMALTRMSAELSADSAIAMGDYLAQAVAYAIADREDEDSFNGDGTSTYGGHQGLRYKLEQLTAGTAPGLPLGAGSASWTALTRANFNSVTGALPQYAEMGSVTWLCHKTFFYTVMNELAMAAGGTTMTEMGNGLGRPMFMGYPVEFSQVYPSTAAASHVPVTLGAHEMGAVFGDRQTLAIDFSTEASVGGQSVFERNQIAVRGVSRFSVVAHDVGSDTVAGPIVGLETGA